MKNWLPALLALLVLDAALFAGFRRVAVERAELTRGRSELLERVEARRVAAERDEKMAEVVELALSSTPEAGLDIAGLRDLLIDAEHGLGLDRFSLDFRPARDLSGGASGGRVQASLSGSFRDVYEYLRRVESLRETLVPEELGLRSEAGTRVALTIRWGAVLRLPERDPRAFSSEEIERLKAWLAPPPSAPPSRNLFFLGDDASLPDPLPSPGAERRPGAAEPELAERARDEAPLPPRLTGFVLARPELESDVGRRVLAALRFDGELRLVKVGDVVGGFRVERIEARDSVVLVHQENGKRLQLFLN